ncbi:MAG: 30S ribosomal protein S3 [Mycoplasmataceae bacterium RC_NB112A]|nr:MAG: 30S ribosomal protein S3 [Mycoplasmataceae bacterium RC_NB112A]KLL01874.1 MAG: 30S ribosomal protein S3 [Mycoplasmataceae bacterium RC_NB112A]
MAQRASPHAMRLGYNQDWDVYYFARNKRENLELIQKVEIIQKHFYSRWKRNIARLKIELNSTLLFLKLYVDDTSIILGENNQNLEKILQDLYRSIQNDKIRVDLEIVKVKSPYANAQLVSNMIAEQVEKRLSSRRILKFFVEKVLAEPEVKGLRINIDGLLDGATMTRKKEMVRAKIPLNTLDIQVEEGKEIAIISRGTIGVKVLIYKGKARPGR